MSFVHLRLRTEYSFRRVYGRPEEVLAAAGTSAAAITDYGTWGHVHWWETCEKEKVRPILGVEVLCVPQPTLRERQPGPSVALLARNEEGLREIYEEVSYANAEGFYYVPRTGYARVNRLSDNVCILSGVNADLSLLKRRDNVWLEFNPSSRVWNRALAGEKKWKKVVCCDNFYPRTDDRESYEIVAGERGRRTRTSIMHIPSPDELALSVPEAPESAYKETERIAKAVTLAALPKASMVTDRWALSLREQCERGKKRRKLTGKRWTKTYEQRLERELEMIIEKNFTDYFQVIAEMVNNAKRTMFVGPARGSAAGSLVCYLIGITDVDPIVHGLMFERFIDVTRSDLPDVDLDFPDTKRDLVIEQLRERWGADRVGRIGTVSRYKPKSALSDVARELSVPVWEVEDVKDTITERSSGDERAAFAVSDALEDTDLGKALVEKYPGMKLAGKIEGHARHSGMHAAGVVVTSEPLVRYTATDHSGSIQLDKEDAEALNMLKIDALGLRTLSVLEDCLEQIGKTPQWLVEYPLDDKEAFELLNAERYAGIFQFEGYALQALCRQMKIRQFSDISSITALARPGPLHCGAANEFVERRLGRAEVQHLHPTLEDVTADTYGTVVYQEQVMFTCRRMGMFPWEDVSFIRKAMSKTLGEETFNRYWIKFKQGAAEQGVPEREARAVWDKICTFGSWAFNKSHAVSYGLISYWCAVLKAHWPLEYGAACLRNAKDEDQVLRILRELVTEGYEYLPVDPERSGVTWSVVNGKLVGGLVNIRGIGVKKAEEILERRKSGKGLPPGLIKLLRNPVTPYDHAFETRERFREYFEEPERFRIVSGGLTELKDIHDAGEYVFIAKIRERKLRDMNEAHSVSKRGGRRIRGRTAFLNLVLEDDTGTIIAKIDRNAFPKWGKAIVEGTKTGDYCLWKGRVQEGWRIVYVQKWRLLEERDGA